MVHVLSPLRGDPGSLEDCSGGLLVVQPPDPQLAGDSWAVLMPARSSHLNSLTLIHPIIDE